MANAKAVQLNSMGKPKLRFGDYLVFGLGNFASQLSWTMVSTYLSIFYTDVFGLGTGAVAILMLIAKVWDGINDPMMGTIMERTHTKHGRFRPYIAVGAVFLVIFTVLTFTVPGFGSVGKLVWAYVTYIGLGMSYTMTNVPYFALPAVMSDDPDEINKLNAAQMMGMSIGQIFLNLTVLRLVLLIGKGDQKAGYQGTASLLAFIALPLFWLVAWKCKERIDVQKKYQGSILTGIKNVLTNKNFVLALLYAFCNMFGMMGRLAVAVFFYLHVVRSMQYVTIFMMMQMLVGTLVMPLAAKLCTKYGKRNVAIASMIIQGSSLLLMYFGPSTSVAWNFATLILYGFGYIGGPCGNGMYIDAIDDYDLKTGVRNDGMAFSFSGTANKISSAIANSIFLAIMGAYGYVGGAEVTETVAHGINIVTNLIPGIVFFIGIIPLLFYKLDKPGYMDDVRAKLRERNLKRAAEDAAEAEAAQ